MSQLVLPLPVSSAQSRADFITAPGNERALAFIDAFPAWPAPHAVLVGPPASGKSHLAAVWAAKADAPVMEAANLEAGVPGGALVVENVGAQTPQAPLFALLERGAPLLLTSQLSPAAWPFELPDLKSRANALLAFELWAPDEALLMTLAVKLFADRQVTVPQIVISRMIASLERSPGAIRDFVARADAAALVRKSPINVSLIRDLMGSLDAG